MYVVVTTEWRVIMNYQFLTTTNLFRGMSMTEAKSILSCLNANEKQYKKGEIIYYNGESIKNIGFIMSGSVNISIDDLWGNSAIIGHSEPGQLFAEVYACIPSEPLMVNVTACENCDILFLNASRLMTTCKNACPFHNQLIRNLLQITASKNLALSLRNVHILSKSIRGRLSSYLSEQAKKMGVINLQFLLTGSNLLNILALTEVLCQMN
jgi:CRP-like cAMP-binding protein